MNRSAPILLAALLFGSPALAQTVFLSEDFSSGVVPPANWSELNNGNNLGWEPNVLNLTGTMAWHDDFLGLNDNHLLSPQMDLSTTAAAYLHFDQEVVFSSWRDHHYVDVSLDNGVTFLNVLDDVSGDGVHNTTVNLSAYAGINGVNVSFHYTGDFASEWGVDEIQVDDSPTGPPLGILATAVNPTNGRTYHLLEVSNWSRAESSAVALGGHLVTIDDQIENDWVNQTFATWGGLNRTIWAGLNDVALEGTWQWADGSPVGFLNWAPGEPNNSTVNDPVNGEDHVCMYSGTGTWNDLHDTSYSPWFPNLSGVVEMSGGGGPFLTVSNLIAGQTATFQVSNATAGGAVGIGYSYTGGGPVTANAGPCGPQTVDLSHPITILPIAVAGANGVASLQAAVPAGTTGIIVWLQGMDVATCTLTNGVMLTIG